MNLESSEKFNSPERKQRMIERDRQREREKETTKGGRNK